MFEEETATRFVQQQELQPQNICKTPLERMHEDAIFLSQNTKTNYFNIQSFNTSFLERKSKTRENSSLAISKETLLERNNEKSPLYFKISGCVAYCAQLNGCCIFYNRGITKEEMPILYSVQCQQEVFEEACKLYENSIPSYKFLFQLSFSTKLRNTFRLLGLSEDTLLLKVKNEAPSQRNKFMYNTAMLQLQMMRFDFIISPNITQYYVKQFLSASFVQANHRQSAVSVCQKQDILTTLMPQDKDEYKQPQDATRKRKQKDTSNNNNEDTSNYVNAADFKINHKRKAAGDREDDESLADYEENSDDADDDDADEDEETDSSSVASSEFNDFNKEYDYDAAKRKIIVQNTSVEEKHTKQAQPLDEKALRRIMKRPSSLVSSSDTVAGEKRCHVAAKSITSQESSVDFVMPSNKSETGVTEKFSKLMTENTTMQCTTYARGTNTNKLKPKINIQKQISTYAPSSTGMTENVADLSLNDDGSGGGDGGGDDDDNKDYRFNDIATTSKANINNEQIYNTTCREQFQNLIECIDKRRPSVFGRNINMRNSDGYIVYNPRFLETLIEMDDIVDIQECFNDFIDLHRDVETYVRINGYFRGNRDSIAHILREVKLDELNRLKQAVFLYLLSDEVQLKNTPA